MKIAFFSEGGYTGKVPRNNPNMRTDTAWVCALEATHHPIPTIHQIPDNSYDIGIIIIPISYCSVGFLAECISTANLSSCII